MPFTASRGALRPTRIVLGNTLLGLTLLLAPLSVVPGTPAAPALAAAALGQVAARRAYGRLPLSFERNDGQAPPEVQYLARGRGYTLFLTPSEAVLVLRPPAPPTQQGAASSAPTPGRAEAQGAASSAPATRGTGQRADADSPGDEPSDAPQPTAVRLQLVGGDATAPIAGEAPLPSRVNYFLGNDPAGWHTDVPSYGGVRYHAVYPGIDLVYYGNGPELEYDFVVAPGADPSVIALRFDGADGVTLDAAGDLVLATPSGVLRQRRPHVYQDLDDARQEIGAAYVLRPDSPIDSAPAPSAQHSALDRAQRVAPLHDPTQHSAPTTHHAVTFALGAYDPARPLVIDPGFDYSTYLGGNGIDEGTGIALDSAGNAYVTGGTQSIDFPTTAGALKRICGTDSFCNSTYYDVFVTKLNPTGSALVYSTYIGGSGHDYPHAIAIDGAGNAYIAGRTSSTNFPTATPTGMAPPLQPNNAGGSFDGFVAKLNAAGNTLTYSTYLGGGDIDEVFGIALDSSGNAYVTGGTASANFPTTASAYQPTYSGATDAFVAKINPSATALVYSTYLGGGAKDVGYAIAVDSAGLAYVTGYTESNIFPGMGDAFLMKLSASGGSRLYANYYGSAAGPDTGRGIVADNSGTVWITGDTLSGFATTPGAFQTTSGGGSDAFVMKISTSGGGDPIWSTFLGGVGLDQGNAIAIDSFQNVYVVGETFSHNFPVLNAMQPTNAGDKDAFIAKLNSSGTALLYSTYLGGFDDDSAAAVAVDAMTGKAYLTGYTFSTNLTTTVGSFQPAAAGGLEAFVAEVAPRADLRLVKTASTDTATTGTDVHYTLTLDNLGEDAAVGVTLTDPLPAGVTFQSIGVPSPAVCATPAVGSGGTITCHVASLAAGAGLGIAVTVRVGAASPGSSLTNTASVTSLTFDRNPSNNTSSAGVAIAAACRPRPPVDVRVALAATAGRLQVTITATTSPGIPSNQLASLQFGAASGALIDGPGGQNGSTGNFTYTPPAGSTSATFFVRQATAGAAATVPLTVTDSCGAWPTFVGGGPTAFGGGGPAAPAPTAAPTASTPVVPNPTAAAPSLTTAPSPTGGAANPAVACASRPAVSVTTTPGGAGRLQVTVAASGVGNTLRALAFGPATNAAVEASGQRGPGGFTATLPANTTTTRFTLSRTIAGQAATVPLTMTDACGDWPTVVGGGPSAF